MKKHILLIEDDRNELAAFVRALNHIDLPCKCTYAEDYDHALKMLDYLVPDYLFIDLSIPDKDCVDCLQQIRQKPSLAHTTMLLYADSVTGEIQRRAQSVGIERCIRKPATEEELHRLLEDVLLAGSEN